MESSAALETSGRGAVAKTRQLPSLSTQQHDTAHTDPPTDDNTEDESDAWESAVTSPASVTSPPYWRMQGTGHRRSISNMSAESIVPIGAITMRDNETSGHDERNKACWAKSVSITDYVIVNGSATNIGAFVVWNIRVETLQVSLLCDGCRISGGLSLPSAC